MRPKKLQLPVALALAASMLSSLPATAAQASPGLPLATTSASSSQSCQPPIPKGGLVLITPSNAALPAGGSAVLEATGLPLLPLGTAVYFKVTCGPDAGEKATGTVELHPGSVHPTDRAAYFTLANRPSQGQGGSAGTGGAGTDVVTATVTAPGHQSSGFVEVNWQAPVPAIDCDEPASQLGYLKALWCQANDANSMVHDTLLTMDCALNIATFFVPAGKVGELLKDASDVVAAGEDIEKLRSEWPTKSSTTKFTDILRVALDLAQLNKDDNGQLSVLFTALGNATSLPDFLHAIADILAAVADSPSTELVHLAGTIGTEVLDWLGLGSCLTLLGRIVTGSSTGAVTTGPPTTVAPSTTVPAPSTNGSASPLWTVPLTQPDNPDGLPVSPTGSMVAPGCADVTLTGKVAWALAKGCSSAIGDAYGNTYLSVQPVAGLTSFVESLGPAGRLRWRTPIDGDLSGWRPALGANGSVFFSVGSDIRGAAVMGFDEQTGAVTLNHGTGSTYDSLAAYGAGLVAANAGNVSYLSYAGTVLHSYDAGNGFQTPWGSSIAFGANGSVLLAGYDECGAQTKLNLVKITPTGHAWTWIEPEPYGPSCDDGGTFVSASTDGGAIVGSFFGLDGPAPVTFMSIGPSGSLRWTESPGGGDAGPPVVDKNGIVGLPTDQAVVCADGTTKTCSAMHIDFLSEKSTTPTLSPFEWADTTDANRGWDFGDTDISIFTGHIYVVRGVPPAVWTLSAFSEPGLATSFAPTAP